MSCSMEKAHYILGQSDYAERRLELLNELSATNCNFDQAVHMLPKHEVTVLILGCGCGHLEAKLSQLFSESRFIGIDIGAKRIEESIARTSALKDTNRYEYIQADLATIAVDELHECDIMISRFVLSHLKNPLKCLDRFLPLIRSGGYFWAEELASNGSEYYCNIPYSGYTGFVKLVQQQIQVQQCSFETGWNLLSNLIDKQAKVLFSYLSQPILSTARQKSILRLGIEDAKESLLSQFSECTLESVIVSLKEFEEDERAFALYTRSLSFIVQMSGDF